MKQHSKIYCICCTLSGSVGGRRRAGGEMKGGTVGVSLLPPLATFDPFCFHSIYTNLHFKDAKIVRSHINSANRNAQEYVHSCTNTV